jgi:16S rRNA (guanine966-N2)-methyltransferase
LIANRVRIIGGEYRSRILRFPARPGLRPTPDRVRETLFNWLGQDLSGRACLDLFAGSGALGFEAVSRGAQPVVMVERDQRTYQALVQNARALGCETAVELCREDALEFARRVTGAFDVVFLDPPFNSGLIAALEPLVPRLIRSGGAVYVESADGIKLQPPWRLHRKGIAGHVTFQVFIHGDQ